MSELKALPSLAIQKIFLVAIFGCITLLSLYKAFIQQETNISDIIINHPHQDFGSIRQQESHEMVYSFKNNTEKSLLLGPINVSCSCTDAKLSKYKLEPKEECALTLIFESGAYRGLVKGTALVNYNFVEDKTRKVFIVDFQANVRPDYDFEPKRLDFTYGKKEQKRVILYPMHGELIQILNLSCSRKWIEANMSSDKTRGSEICFDVFYSGEEFEILDNEAVLTVKTDNMREPNYLIPIMIKP